MRERMVGDVGFDEDVRGLFTEGDRACMAARGLDLWDWFQMRMKASDVLAMVNTRQMPPGNPWGEDQIALLQHWIDDGCPKRRGRTYFEYFGSIDRQTEYEVPAGSELMATAIIVMRDVLPTWKQYVEFSDDPSELEDLVELLEEDAKRDAVVAIDDMLTGLTVQFFADGQAIDFYAVLDAFEQFGRDRLPLDPERQQHHADHFDPHHHRMDSTPMWFNWAGQLECAAILAPEDGRMAARHAMMAGLVGGSLFDFVFRPDAKGAKDGHANPRAPVPDGFVRDPSTERRIHRRAQKALRSWDRSVTYIHEQYKAYI